MKVVIIGSGNVANILGRKIKESGNEILQIAGRKKKSVSELASLLNASECYNISLISNLADIYIIAVSDNALPEIADVLRVNNKIVVHTAAAQPCDILKCCSVHYGVIYPLQTLHKNVQNIPDIPLLLNGESKETVEVLKNFCSAWSDQVLIMNDDDRLKMHVCAVFTNNFANHLFAIAKDYCTDNNLDFNLLKPLISETACRLQNNEPENIQTGPAVRNDLATISRHRHLMAEYPEMLKLYNQLTDSITNFYRDK